MLKVAEKLGYKLRPVAPAARIGGLTTLGLIVKTEPHLPPRANPFYSHVIMGVEEACRRLQVNCLFAALPVDERNRPVEVPPVFASDVANGLLMVGTFVDETILRISGRHTPPIILVDAYSNTERYDSVVSDNFAAAYQAVEYLLRQGHRHIGLLGSDPDAYPSLRQRRNGYLRALKENGIANTYIADSPSDHAVAQVAACQLLSAHPQITALFGVNDEMALAAISAAQDAGRCVPENLSVVGYDDIDLAANAHPPLTTMHVDTIAMGRAAVHMLMDRLEHPAAAAPRRTPSTPPSSSAPRSLDPHQQRTDSMTRIIGDGFPHLPWEERRAGSAEVVWRYSANPIIPANLLPTSNSIFNSAVVPFGKGFAGVFRCDSNRREMLIHSGCSEDGLHWLY